MRRREFIGLLGGAAGALTCADVFAAQKSPIARIGLLSFFPFPDCKSLPQEPPCLIAPELRALGWRAANAMGVTVPATLVARADKVIE